MSTGDLMMGAGMAGVIHGVIQLVGIQNASPEHAVGGGMMAIGLGLSFKLAESLINRRRVATPNVPARQIPEPISRRSALG